MSVRCLRTNKYNYFEWQFSTGNHSVDEWSLILLLAAVRRLPSAILFSYRTSMSPTNFISFHLTFLLVAHENEETFIVHMLREFKILIFYAFCWMRNFTSKLLLCLSLPVPSHPMCLSKQQKFIIIYFQSSFIFNLNLNSMDFFCFL